MAGSSRRAPTGEWPAWALLRHFRHADVGDAGTESLPKAAAVPQARTGPDDGLRVLVADDNPVNLMVASEMLSCWGIAALLAADGAEAVALAGELHLDLILMDLQMPVLDGLAATLQIRRFERDLLRARVPVVAYTTSPAESRWSRDFGIDDVLEKPCDQQALRKCLLRWCPEKSHALAPPRVAVAPRH